MLPPPPPGADKAMEKKMEMMEKKMSKKLADDLGLTKEQQERAEKIRSLLKEKSIENVMITSCENRQNELKKYF